MSRDRQAALEMIRLSGQQGVPVIAVDDQVVVGFNRPRLEQLLAHRPAAGPPARSGLGALVGDAARIALRRPGTPTSGAYVGGVRPGSPAAGAGLRAGDVITAVAGRPVTTAADLEAALGATPTGRAVALTILRDGTPRAVEVAL